MIRTIAKAFWVLRHHNRPVRMHALAFFFKTKWPLLEQQLQAIFFYNLLNIHKISLTRVRLNSLKPYCINTFSKIATLLKLIPLNANKKIASPIRNGYNLMYWNENTSFWEIKGLKFPPLETHMKNTRGT